VINNVVTTRPALEILIASQYNYVSGLGFEVAGGLAGQSTCYLQWPLTF